MQEIVILLGIYSIASTIWMIWLTTMKVSEQTFEDLEDRVEKNKDKVDTLDNKTFEWINDDRGRIRNLEEYLKGNQKEIENKVRESCLLQELTQGTNDAK